MIRYDATTDTLPTRPCDRVRQQQQTQHRLDNDAATLRHCDAATLRHCDTAANFENFQTSVVVRRSSFVVRRSSLSTIKQTIKQTNDQANDRSIDQTMINHCSFTHCHSVIQNDQNDPENSKTQKLKNSKTSKLQNFKTSKLKNPKTQKLKNFKTQNSKLKTQNSKLQTTNDRSNATSQSATVSHSQSVSHSRSQLSFFQKHRYSRIRISHAP